MILYIKALEITKKKCVFMKHIDSVPAVTLNRFTHGYDVTFRSPHLYV
jgi:hypothetical protein